MWQLGVEAQNFGVAWPKGKIAWDFGFFWALEVNSRFRLSGFFGFRA